MLIFRVGTDIEKRKKTDKDIPHSTDTLSGENIAGIPQFLADDIFGGKIVVRIENWQLAEYRDVLYKYLDDIKESKNIFIIDESDILAATATKISKYASKFLDCRVDKVDHSKEAFKLGDYIISKDKKNAWLLLMRLKGLNVPAEEVQGALAWKAKSARSKNMFFNMLIARHKAHNSEGIMYDDMEKFILGM